MNIIQKLWRKFTRKRAILLFVALALVGCGKPQQQQKPKQQIPDDFKSGVLYGQLQRNAFEREGRTNFTWKELYEAAWEYNTFPSTNSWHDSRVR